MDLLIYEGKKIKWHIQSTVEFLTFLFKIFRLSILEKADSSASALWWWEIMWFCMRVETAKQLFEIDSNRPFSFIDDISSIDL